MFIQKPPPFDLQGVSAKFYGDIPYDLYNETIMDVWLPASGTPTGVIVGPHGGGFSAGDKTQMYNTNSKKNEIIDYLDNNIAYVAMNYRLIHTILERDGVKKSLFDGKSCIKFLQQNADFFNLNVSKVALTGTSAGAGMALWIGTDASLKIAGVAAMETQSTYDLLVWEHIFEEFDINLEAWSIETGTELSVFNFYGITSFQALHFPVIQQYRQSINMLGLMSEKTPEIYLRSSGQPAGYPDDLNKINHHPYHAKAVYDKALEFGVPAQLYAPNLNIDTTNESKKEFLIRKAT